MIPDPELAQLYVIRAQLDLLISAKERAIEAGPVDCPHPEDKRRDLTNMTEEPHFLCLVCRQDVKGQA